jgi:hypothetical protein
VAPPQLVAPRANPLEVEALGQESVAVTLAGRLWRAPADVDLWPLRYVLASRGIDEFDRPTINVPALIAALKGILGAQWLEFVELIPDQEGLIEASNLLASAAGFPGGDDDLTFGKLPTTLLLLARWPDKVESDLDRFWRRDLADRYRFDGDRRLLTLRQIHARLQNLPAESSLAIALGRRSGAELLLMDVFKAIAGREHPARPLTPEEAAQARAEQSAVAEARAKYRERQDRRKNARAGAAALAQRNAAERAARVGGSQHAEAS